MTHDNQEIMTHDTSFTHVMDECVNDAPQLRADGALDQSRAPHVEGGTFVGLSLPGAAEPYDSITHMFNGNTQHGVNPQRSGNLPIDAQKKFSYGCASTELEHRGPRICMCSGCSGVCVVRRRNLSQGAADVALGFLWRA